MKKVVNNIGVFFIIFAVIYLSCFPCFAVSGESVDYSKKLLSVGYPEEVVSQLPDSMKEKIVSSIGDFEVEAVNVISGNCNSTENLTMKTLVAELKDKKTGEYEGRSVCVYWQYEKNPIVKMSDYIEMKWDTKEFCRVEDSLYIESYWRNKETEQWNAFDVNTAAARGEQGAVVCCVKLKNFKKHIGGCLVFNLEPRKSGEIYDNNKSDVYANYTHNTSRFIIILAYIIEILLLITIIVLIIIRMIDTKKQSN